MHRPRIQPRRLVLVGSVLIDILLYVDHIPERGGDTISHQTVLATGGGFNVLIGSTRLGMPVAYAGRVGDGPMGKQVLVDLADAGILTMLPNAIGEDTGFDIGLVEPDAERTFVTAPGVEAKLHLDDLHAIPLLPGDAVYVSGYDLCYPISGESLEIWLPTLSPNSLLVFDPGPLLGHIPPGRLEKILARTDLISLNAREIDILTGIADITQAAKQLVPRIASSGYVIARVGSQGCWVAGEGFEPVHEPTRLVQAIDTTGAGDAHTAALLAHLALGNDILTAVRIANLAASISVTKRGPATGATSEELAELLATMPFQYQNRHNT